MNGTYIGRGRRGSNVWIFDHSNALYEIQSAYICSFEVFVILQLLVTVTAFLRIGL